MLGWFCHSGLFVGYQTANHQPPEHLNLLKHHIVGAIILVDELDRHLMSAVQINTAVHLAPPDQVQKLLLEAKPRHTCHAQSLRQASTGR